MNLPSFAGFESDRDSFRTMVGRALQYETLDAAREIHAIRQMRRGDDEARAQLLQSLYAQIVFIASRLWRPGISPEDLVQEGCIGALEGMEHFDEQRCVRLQTFVRLYIWKRMVEHLWAFTGVTDPTRTKRQVMREVKAQELQLLKELGRHPTALEVASRMGLPVSHVDAVRGERQKPAPLHAIYSGKTLSQLPALDDDVWGKSVRLRDEQVLMAGVQKVLGMLPERVGKAAWLLFGCDGHPPVSLRELSDILPYSYHGLRKIHAEALRHLHQVLLGLPADEPLGKGKSITPASSRRPRRSSQPVDISRQGD